MKGVSALQARRLRRDEPLQAQAGALERRSFAPRGHGLRQRIIAGAKGDSALRQLDDLIMRLQERYLLEPSLDLVPFFAPRVVKPIAVVNEGQMLEGEKAAREPLAPRQALGHLLKNIQVAGVRLFRRVLEILAELIDKEKNRSGGGHFAKSRDEARAVAVCGQSE